MHKIIFGLLVFAMSGCNSTDTTKVAPGNCYFNSSGDPYKVVSIQKTSSGETWQLAWPGISMLSDFTPAYSFKTEKSDEDCRFYRVYEQIYK